MEKATNKAIVGNMRRNLEDKKKGLVERIAKGSMGPEYYEEKSEG